MRNAARRIGTAAVTEPFSFVDGSQQVVGFDIELAKRVAKQQGKTLEAHYAHLIVHGMLHLQGYDHETGDDDAQRMEDKERAILASLGFDDPYQDRKE